MRDMIKTRIKKKKREKERRREIRSSYMKYLPTCINN